MSILPCLDPSGLIRVKSTLINLTKLLNSPKPLLALRCQHWLRLVHHHSCAAFSSSCSASYYYLRAACYPCILCACILFACIFHSLSIDCVLTHAADVYIGKVQPVKSVYSRSKTRSCMLHNLHAPGSLLGQKAFALLLSACTHTCSQQPTIIHLHSVHCLYLAWHYHCYSLCSAICPETASGACPAAAVTALLQDTCLGSWRITSV